MLVLELPRSGYAVNIGWLPLVLGLGPLSKRYQARQGQPLRACGPVRILGKSVATCVGWPLREDGPVLELGEDSENHQSG